MNHARSPKKSSQLLCHRHKPKQAFLFSQRYCGRDWISGGNGHLLLEQYEYNTFLATKRVKTKRENETENNLLAENGLLVKLSGAMRFETAISVQRHTLFPRDRFLRIECSLWRSVASIRRDFAAIVRHLWPAHQTRS